MYQELQKICREVFRANLRKFEQYPLRLKKLHTPTPKAKAVSSMQQTTLTYTVYCNIV